MSPLLRTRLRYEAAERRKHPFRVRRSREAECARHNFRLVRLPVWGDGDLQSEMTDTAWAVKVENSLCRELLRAGTGPRAASSL